MPNKSQPPLPLVPQGDALAAMMSALLPVHGALTLEWLVDAASTAAERGLGIPYTFVYLEDQEGRLEQKAPASDLRRRSLQRAIDALGPAVLSARLDPRALPALAEALDGGSPLTAPLGDFFAPLLSATLADEAARSLSIDTACMTPLETAGERLGALLALGGNEINPHHLRLLGEHVACAAVNLRNVTASREQGVMDVVRSVFDARKLDAELQREVQRATRFKREVSVCVIEATNLRLLRERFGRFLTDRLLQQLGESLAEHSREIDVIGAFKESGYTMVLTEASASGAETAARRLRGRVENLVLGDGEAVPGLELHLAVGWATCPQDGVTTDSLLAAAERRMYEQAA